MKKEGSEVFNMGSADKRIIELKLKKGELTDAFLAKYLATLPDVSALAEEVPAEMDRKKPSKG